MDAVLTVRLLALILGIVCVVSGIGILLLGSRNLVVIVIEWLMLVFGLVFFALAMGLLPIPT